MSTKQSKYSPHLAKYLWIRFITPLLCCFIGFSFLFTIADAFDVLGDFLDHDATFLDMINFFLSKQPERLTIIAPIAFLLSGLFCFASLSKHNEIVALRASGLSLTRTCSYIWITAIVGAFAVKYTMETVSPTMVERADYLEEKIANPELKIIKNRRLAYRSKENNRDWIFGEFSIIGEKKNVIVTQSRPNNTLDWEIRAETAVYSSDSGDWFFENGQICYYDALGELTKRAAENFAARRFPNLHERPEDIRNSLSPVEQLSSKDIRLVLANNSEMADSTKNSCYATIYYRQFFPIGCIIAMLFAIPLSINSNRSGVFASLGLSILVILSYYGVIHAFLVFGKKGYMPPLLSMIIPTLIYLIAGGILSYKKR